MLKRRTRIVIALIAWQLVSIAVMRSEEFILGPLIAWCYMAAFGDVQDSYARYAWIAVSTAYFQRTTIATFVSLIVFEKLSGREIRWWRLAITFLAWEAVVMMALLAAYKLQLFWFFHEIDWAIFGPPESIYTFRNIMLPRLLAWLVCTVPIGIVALSSFSRQAVATTSAASSTGRSHSS